MRRMSIGAQGCLCVILIAVSGLIALAADPITTGLVAVGQKGMVASDHLLASQIGAEILAQGGNAVDAAVATAFAIGLVAPYCAGIGGEGMMLITLADGTEVAIDFRSWAPGHVTKETPVNKYGPKSVCIPGQVAGLAMALEKYGTMTLAEVLEPVIKLAREGFPYDEWLAGMVSYIYDDILEQPAAAELFLNPDGTIPEVGSTFTNTGLAQALELIAKDGPAAFYKGPIADAIVEATEGWITHEDLAAYRAVERDPIRGSYRGYELLTAPPPVGGTILVEALNILEHFNLAAFHSPADPMVIHLIAQALLLAWADFDQYVADPGFIDVPVAQLIDKRYARERLKLIRLNQTLEPGSVPAGDPYHFAPVAAQSESRDAVATSGSTTHISVVDAKGNVVALTQTISSAWGSRVFVPRFGFPLNNEFRNFKGYNPDQPNDLDYAGPHKRPRTELCPTIIRKSGNPIWVLGTHGSARIPSTVLETIVNLIDFGMDLYTAIVAPKFCSSTRYKELRMETGFPVETVTTLEDMGYVIKTYGELDWYFGGVNAIQLLDKYMIGVGAPRDEGSAAGVW
ncbi:gamma-glutamyltransferase [Candidatus Acetothermia bacterium]|nr:MAG: gamma-glutamyltransferase [Candidatus Acetothermia bacterium]